MINPARRKFLTCMLVIGVVLAAPSASANPYADDAQAMQRIIAENYAYSDRFGAASPLDSQVLRGQAAAVTTETELLRHAESILLSLADHHAITARSFADSWALVPSYADLWIVERDDGHLVIDAVREGSPTERAGVRSGDELMAISGVATGPAVTAFWRDLGLVPFGREAREFAARVLAAGRRDRPRNLTIRSERGTRRLSLASLYAQPQTSRALLSVTRLPECLTIRFNDSLGKDETVAAFDMAMAEAAGASALCIDLRDTPGGGNTTVARAVMGWFTTRSTGYQIHRLPAEERETGIARQWIEQVLPRAGKHYSGRVLVHVGRWTGSMGEGLAIGLKALGGELAGSDMAGLRGAVYDFTLPHSQMVIKLPAERLYTVDGTPREDVHIEAKMHRRRPE